MPNYGPKIVRDGLISQIDFANPRTGPINTNTYVNLFTGANNFTGQNSPTVSNNIFSANGLNPGTFMSENTGGLGNHGTSSFSYQFLINPKISSSLDNSAYARIYEQTGFPDTYHILSIIHNNGNPYYNFTVSDLNGSGTIGVQTTVGTAILNEWVFLTSVCDREEGRLKIYINETKYQSSVIDFTGKAYGNNDSLRFPSSFAEIEADYSCFLIYDKAVTDDEVSQNFRAFRGRFGL